jgi:hypothetical protein
MGTQYTCYQGCGAGCAFQVEHSIFSIAQGGHLLPDEYFGEQATLRIGLALSIAPVTGRR